MALVPLALVGGPTAAATVSDAVASTVGPVVDGSGSAGDGASPPDPLATGPNESVVDGHAAAVADRGSATTTLELRRTEGSETVVIDRTARIDFDQRVLFENNIVEISLYSGLVRSEPLRIQQYDAPGETYTRTSSSLVDRNYTQYDANGSERWSSVDARDRLYTTGLHGLDNLSWTRTRTEQFDGTEVVRYVATDADDIAGQDLNLTVRADLAGNDSSRSIATNLGNVTITDASAIALVDTSGVVRYVEYNVTVLENNESVTYVATLSYSDLGVTSVPRPAWAQQSSADGMGSANVTDRRTSPSIRSPETGTR